MKSIMTEHNDRRCASFSQIHWHDSKLLDLHLQKHPERNQYDLRMDLDLIQRFSEDQIERRKQTAVFRDCRIIQADLDLLGVVMCGGDIGAAACYPDAIGLEKRKRDKIRQFDLPQNQNPLAQCMGFFFEMIPPGGEIIIFAQDFELM
jgi:hypothetical protein